MIEKIFRQKTTLLIASSVLLNVILITVFFSNGHTVSEDEMREFTTILRSKGLYREAAAEYSKYLMNARLSRGQRANLHFILAGVYKNELFDYEKAMSSYLKVTQLVKKGELCEESRKQIIECLDRLGRNTEAISELNEIASISSVHSGIFAGKPVAKIGEKIITEQEIDRSLDELSQTERASALSGGRAAYIEQYVFDELLFRHAQRLEIGRDQDFLRKFEKDRKRRMREELFLKVFYDKYNVDSEDLKRYYSSHRQHFTAGGVILSMEEALEQVKIGAVREKILLKREEILKEFLQDFDIKMYFEAK
ncbi:MAG TPA: hypothetical protein DC049_16295 [Spirochaetia bacterium]|nr:hypothetical protein [Spirochaetia bacterium]